MFLKRRYGDHDSSVFDDHSSDREGDADYSELLSDLQDSSEDEENDPLSEDQRNEEIDISSAESDCDSGEGNLEISQRTEDLPQMFSKTDHLDSSLSARDAVFYCCFHSLASLSFSSCTVEKLGWGPLGPQVVKTLGFDRWLSEGLRQKITCQPNVSIRQMAIPLGLGLIAISVRSVSPPMTVIFDMLALQTKQSS